MEVSKRVPDLLLSEYLIELNNEGRLNQKIFKVTTSAGSNTTSPAI